MAGGKLNNSIEPREQQENTPIIVISDDEDGNNSGYKELTTSDLASNITKWVASNGVSQAFETMHVEGDKNTQNVPYGQSAALVNQFPLQTSWQPSIQFERVVLQKRPEEQRMQDLVAVNIAEKRAEAQVFLSHPTEKKRKRSALACMSAKMLPVPLGKGKENLAQIQ
ncbi:hypothetical protein PVAP13_2NG443803 [Panicum virgatum]|uniref:Uncharacterized protein n=1 Tax=Panicum virgatum TaxID=38727 RepID=A0A8T0VSS0_PANVG|nr:hypothetical protein PVAP13_2NG443803 [Panicum virgatum]